MLSIELDDFLFCIDLALDGLTGIAIELGDDLVNARPDLPGANSAYAIVTHCLGVMTRWGGDQIAGRVVQRDRDAEFRATGTVADLLAAVRLGRAQLGQDLAQLDSLAPPRGVPDPEDRDLPLGRAQGAIALHIYEELVQHLGQLEITRDLLRAKATGGSDSVG